MDFDGKPQEHWLRSRLTGDDETRWKAIDAIRHICVPSVSIPLFFDTLRTDPFWRARALAAHALCDIAYDNPNNAAIVESIPVLVECAADPSFEVREQLEELLKLLRGHE
jgi:hypothetical protein